MKLAKKILSIGTILFTAITSLLIIANLFRNDLFGGSFDVYFILGSIAVGGFFAINSLNMLGKNKIIGWTSLGLISTAVCLCILNVFINNNLFINITLSLGLLSVLFNIIVSSGLDLGKKHLIWQIIVYVIIAITDVISSLLIFNIMSLDSSNAIAMFISLIILSIVGVVVLKVLAKKQLSDRIERSKLDENMVKITKEEYQMLVEKAKKYDEIISKNQV